MNSNFGIKIFFETDGSLNEMSCFRIYGRVTAKEFFDSLKRIDDNRGTTYQRGNDEVGREVHFAEGSDGFDV